MEPHPDATLRDRLDAYLHEHDLEAVWFARPNGFRWLTGGDNVVDRESDIGVTAAGYDGDLRVVTNTIEAPRFRNEELPEIPVDAFPWYDGSLAEAVADRSPTPAAADFDVPGFASVDDQALRTPLTESGIETYRALGERTAEVVEWVAREARPDDTEREVASRLAGAFAEQGIESPVVLVGSAERAQQYRHYTPQDVELGDYALLSVTTQRAGLHASCTRTRAFDPPEWLEDRYAVAASVEATALAATREAARNGGTAGDVFEAIQDAYAAGGFEDEWEHHHQGGAAGYAGREWKGTPDADATVWAPMAYAWNPTVQGAKSEGTVLVTEDDIETLTTTGEWPTHAAEAVGYDVTLDRPAPLVAE